ncbi:MAG: hypothetical protein MJY54_00330 [archaeon]|nr:hypothetical protein [archaeon]
MALSLVTGKKWSYWRLDSPISLLSRADSIILLLSIASFLTLFLLDIIIVMNTGKQFFELAYILAIPFFIVGVIWYYRFDQRDRCRLFLPIILATLSVLAFMYLGKNYLSTIFFLNFILIGSFGVAYLVSLLQKALFYPIVGIVQNMNMKEKYNFSEYCTAFMFNIPRDLDTRGLTMDYNLKRASIPWKEISDTMVLSLMFGIFLWIYLSMNPTFMKIESYGNVPINLFTIVLFIPITVMPWSIFRALNVRISTKFRDFHLYTGIIETIKRMILPIFGTFMFIITAFNKNDPISVLSFIALSIIMNISVIGFVSLIYYRYFENDLVDNIVQKWKLFRPIEILMSIGDSEGKETNYPGTPKRDPDDYGELIFQNLIK